MLKVATHMHSCKLHTIMLTLTCTYYACSEIYEGRRWHEDPRFQAPMIINHTGEEHIYVGDIVYILDSEYGRCNAKVLKFVTEVFFMYTLSVSAIYTLQNTMTAFSCKLYYNYYRRQLERSWQVYWKLLMAALWLLQLITSLSFPSPLVDSSTLNRSFAWPHHLNESNLNVLEKKWERLC